MHQLHSSGINSSIMWPTGSIHKEDRSSPGIDTWRKIHEGVSRDILLMEIKLLDPTNNSKAMFISKGIKHYPAPAILKDVLMFNFFKESQSAALLPKMQRKDVKLIKRVT